MPTMHRHNPDCAGPPAAGPARPPGNALPRPGYGRAPAAHRCCPASAAAAAGNPPAPGCAGPR
ncbi:hypothetical protein ABB25_05020 [Stenotrophomonas koreensis]|uniref:Uncharacterized protein n=1 Tax=Stenotrophomonas koreensis TaxID=266128 RepID=A0A0R0C0D5_9GAMM|nr:hypothetical protein ABB25_05020 [Stenotrophomonas koreensis]